MVQKPPVPQAGYRGDPVPGVPAGTVPIPDAAARAERRRRFRRGTWRLTLALLVVWALVTFGVAYFARALSFDFFGWPFSFWVGSQGALLVYVAIIVIYARVMNRREADALAELGEDVPPDAPTPARAGGGRAGPITGF